MELDEGALTARVPKIVIHRQARQKHQSKLTEREHIRCEERMARNAGTYSTISRWLTALLGKDQLTKSALLPIAEKIAQQLHVKIDRDAKRLKDSLICWICENAPQLPAAPVLHTTSPQSNCNSIDWTADCEDDFFDWDA
jgi:hypothetical protein